jgi:peptide deformylase
MRSRFTAYAKQCVDYLIDSTHPLGPHYQTHRKSWKQELLKQVQKTHFDHLTIFGSTENIHFSCVTFSFSVRMGQTQETYTERSYFKKVPNKDRLLYFGGRVWKGHHPTMMPQTPLLLPLAYFHDRVLHQRAQKIPAITETVINLVDQMTETLEVHQGIGLAAPQVNQPYRLFITKLPPPHGTHEVEVWINPNLVKTGPKICLLDEGCLSLPRIYASVARPEEITLQALHLDGRQIEQTFSGWQARVIQHEYDHLEGILFPTKLSEDQLKELAPSLNLLEETLKQCGHTPS